MSKLLKGTSGRKILKEFPELKKAFFWKSGLWAGTIYFDSVGEKTIDDATHYVRKQGSSPEVKRNLGQQSLLDYTIMPPV